jgi:N4-gp56 family major capsid protein
MKTLEQLQLTTSDLTAILPKIILDEVEKAARPRRVARQAFRINTDLVGSRGRSIYVPKRGALTAEQVGEGAEGTAQKLTYSAVQISPLKYKVLVKITQEALDASEFDLIKDHIEEAGEALADKEDQVLVSKLEATTNPTQAPSSPGTLAYEDLVAARAKVIAAKFQPNLLLINPDQIADLLKDNRFIDASRYGDREPILNGEIGKIAGLKVLESQNITSGKAIVIDSTRACWMAIKRNLQLKRWDNPDTDSVHLNFYIEFGAEVVNTGALCVITNC